MATVNFLYRSTKEKAPLNLRLLFRYKDNDFVIGANTKCEVSKLYWSKEHSQKRLKDIDTANKQLEVNNELNRIENHVLKAFNGVNPEDITKDWLCLQMELYYNPPKQKAGIPTSLIEYIDFYLKYRKHEIKSASITKYNVIKHKLERLQTERKKPILIKDINESFKNEFITYQKAQGYAQNTMHRELTFIKTFCKHARFLGLEVNPQMDTLKVKKEKVPKIWLTFDELERIEKLSDLLPHLENARDWLIISCYTGQRVSDFMRFSKDMIRIEDGKSFLEFTQKKTDKIMTIPLHRKVLEILNKRNGEFPHSISDQRYNDFIKVVCEKAEINQPIKGKLQKNLSEDKKKKKMRIVSGTYPKWELISSHCGRRSFASNFYGTIPTIHLMNVTGHTTEAAFLAYIGKSNKDLAMELTSYFD